MSREELAIKKLHAEATDEVRSVLKRVIQLESQHLYDNQPHVIQDVVNIVKDVVK